MKIGQSWYHKGYTLTEILIALAILGIIMAISIPTMAMQRQKEQRKVVLKEALNILYEIQREGMAAGDLTNTNFKNYYLSRINAVKTCDTNSTTQGCWDASQASVIETTEPGVILASGAQIIGFADCCTWVAPDGIQYHNAILIDWNGKKPPNQYGNDWLWLQICYGDALCPTTLTKPGKIVPWNDAAEYPSVALRDANTALYNEILK